MTRPAFSLGISPCPNDTFIFDALIHDKGTFPFTVQTHMADVEELNTFAQQGQLAITKLSIAAVPEVLDKYILLCSGAALGRGCGPLLITGSHCPPEDHATASIAIPGVRTTANLLLTLHGGYKGSREPMLFDTVMPAVTQRRTGLGLIIHEGRFTYEQRGLSLVQDFGQWWEKETGLPLPLGVIAIRRDLGMEVALQVQEAIKQSILRARDDMEGAMPFIRKHAQEMNEDVMRQHIATFVNDFSVDLGQEGQAAIIRLLEAGAEVLGIKLPKLPVFVE